MRKLLTSISLVLILSVAHSTQSQSKPAEITVSAAASLKDALNDITLAFDKTNPQITVHLNLGASGTLLQQIEQGAPVDVFISAAPDQMDTLGKEQMLRANTRKDLVRNTIVLIVPAGTAQVAAFADLINPSVKFLAIGEPQTVPAGKYAQQVLTHYGIYDTLKPKLVLGKDVRSVLTYVATGNADAGIVYSTDAKTTSQVRVAATAPENSHDPVIYPVAVLEDSKSPEAAKLFEDFLFSAEAQSIFPKYGFTTAK
jgi:molybdate transport system substrate-binding protein